MLSETREPRVENRCKKSRIAVDKRLSRSIALCSRSAFQIESSELAQHFVSLRARCDIRRETYQLAQLEESGFGVNIDGKTSEFSSFKSLAGDSPVNRRNSISFRIVHSSASTASDPFSIRFAFVMLRTDLLVCETNGWCVLRCVCSEQLR